MSIKVECPECKAKRRAADQLAGSEVECPNCSVSVTVLTSDEFVPPRSAAEQYAAASVTPPLPKLPADRRKLWLIGGAITLGLVVAGCLLLVVFLSRSLKFSPPNPASALTHYEVRQLADDYIHGRLDDDTTRLVEAHIEICPQCEHLRSKRTFNEVDRAINGDP